MAGDKNRGSRVSLTLGVFLIAGACGLISGSYLALRDNEPTRALWLLGFGFGAMLIGGIAIGVGLVTLDRPMYYGGDVSPVGRARFSPVPSTPLLTIDRLSEAQSDGEGVSRGSQAVVEVSEGEIRPLDGGTGRRS